MDPAGQGGNGGDHRGGQTSQGFQQPCRKVSQVCKYFHRGSCFHGDLHSYQRMQSPSHLEWGRRHSEPQITLPGSWVKLSRRGSEPTYLSSVAVGQSGAGAHWGRYQPGWERLVSKAQKADGRSWKSSSLPSADSNYSNFLDFRPKSEAAGELMAPLQKLSREKQQREQDSRDIVCGICMDKVWDKPKAQRVFGILPNCTHAHCLGCLRSWRKRRQDFPRDVIKACPQCRVHSSYVIPCQFWVSEGAEKEQLIQSFKAWTSQIPCRFFAQGSRHCPFKSDCIYLHQLQAKAPRSTSLPASRSEVVLEPPAFLQCADLEHELRFVDYAMDVVFWYSELLLNPYSFYRNLQCPRSLCRGWGQQASRLC